MVVYAAFIFEVFGMTIINMTGGGGTRVETPDLQERTVKANEFPTVVEPQIGYDAMTRVTVTVPDNLTAGNIKAGVPIAGVTGTYAPSLQSKVTDADTFPMTILPDAQYEGLSQAVVNTPVNLASGNIRLGVTIAGVEGSYSGTMQTRNITPTMFPTTVTPDYGYDGMSQVKVNAPANLSPSNIREGVQIADIVGTYAGSQVNLEKDRSIKPTSFPYLASPSAGYDGFDQVTITAPDNLVAGNIKSGVSIAGITGTYAPSLQTRSVTPTSFPTTVTYSSGYDGLDTVTINKPSNLTSGNIRYGVSIAGVTGTYRGTGVATLADIGEWPYFRTTDYGAGTAYADVYSQVVSPDRALICAGSGVGGISVAATDATVLTSSGMPSRSVTTNTSTTYTCTLLEGAQALCDAIDDACDTTSWTATGYGWLVGSSASQANGYALNTMGSTNAIQATITKSGSTVKLKWGGSYSKTIFGYTYDSGTANVYTCFVPSAMTLSY